MNSEIRQKLDKVTNIMFSGGLANPITYVEQLSYLLYLKLLDEAENQHTQAEVTKEGLPATAFSHVVHRKMLR
jgi:hypothetical protein